MLTPLLLPAAEHGLLPLFAFPAGAVLYYKHLPILLVVVSLVYSATRYDDWGRILIEAVWWGLKLLAFLVAIGVVLVIVWKWWPSSFSPW